MIEKLKQYSQNGHLEVAKLNQYNQPQKIQFNEMQKQVKNQDKYIGVYKSLETLTWDEKYQWVNFRRLRANQIYRNGQVQEAIQEYLISLIGIDLKGSTQQITKMNNQLKFPITLNIVTCFYKLKQYDKGIELCNKILQEDPTYLPALYKKAYLSMEQGQYTESKECIKNAYNYAKETNNIKQIENFNQLNKSLIKKSKSNKQLYLKIFNQELNEANSESSSLLGITQQQKQEEQQILYPQHTLLQKLFNCCASCFGVWQPRNMIRNRNRRRIHKNV